MNTSPLWGVPNLGHNLALRFPQTVLEFFFFLFMGVCTGNEEGGDVSNSTVPDFSSLSLERILSCFIRWGIFHCWLTQRLPFEHH